MANYGQVPGDAMSPGAAGAYPPAGAYPSPDPWVGQPAGQPSGPPVSPAPAYDYYGNPQQAGFRPGQAAAPSPEGYGQPVYPEGYQPQPWTPQPENQNWPPPENKRPTAIIVLSVLLVLVVIAAAGVGFYLYKQNSKDSNAKPPAQPGVVGDCMVSDGQAEPHTMLVKKLCGPNTYQILKIIPGTTDTGQCDGVAGATDNYKFDWKPNDATGDYVLCLKKQ
jgi:hypothetical protein